MLSIQLPAGIVCPRITDTGACGLKRRRGGEGAVAVVHHWRDRVLQFSFLSQTAVPSLYVKNLWVYDSTKHVNRASSILNISGLSSFALVLLMYFDVPIAVRGSYSSFRVFLSVPLMCCAMVFPRCLCSEGSLYYESAIRCLIQYNIGFSHQHAKVFSKVQLSVPSSMCPINHPC